MTPPLLVVTTLLGGKGPTGVETHFNQILLNAEKQGYKTKLITPYTGNRLVRAFFRPLKNRRDEFSMVLYRRAQGWLIKSQLAAVRRHSKGPITIYAQCPMAAKSALSVHAGDRFWRIILVVHYNKSEVAEDLERGIARRDGPWCRYVAKVEKTALPAVGKIIFGSEYMRREVNGRLPEIARVPQETILNFPPTPAARSSLPPTGDLIAIGTLEPRKNQEFLLHVLANARDRGTRFTLSIIGDGPDRIRLERLCRELSLESQVQFLGFRADACRFIPEYRALVHASRLENCPLTLMEGLSYGRPVLAAAVGGIPELYRDGIEGFFWNLQDPAGAAALLIGLLGDPQKYAAMCGAARERYERVYAPLPSHWVAMLMNSSPPLNVPLVLPRPSPD